MEEDLGRIILKIEDRLSLIEVLSRENKPIPKEIIEETRINALKYFRITGHYYINTYGNR